MSPSYFCSLDIFTADANVRFGGSVMHILFALSCVCGCVCVCACVSCVCVGALPVITLKKMHNEKHRLGDRQWD